MKIKAKRAGAEKVEISPDILHSKLYETLRAWRNKEAERLKLARVHGIAAESFVGNQ